MNNQMHQKNRLASFFGLIIFIALAIVSLFIFSYVLIFIAVLGLILFTINYVKIKFFGASMGKRPINKTYTYSTTRKTANNTTSKNDELHGGRIIDAEQDDKNQ